MPASLLMRMPPTGSPASMAPAWPSVMSLMLLWCLKNCLPGTHRHPCILGPRMVHGARPCLALQSDAGCRCSLTCQMRIQASQASGLSGTHARLHMVLVAPKHHSTALCPQKCDAQTVSRGAPRVAASIMPGPPPDHVVHPRSLATSLPRACARPQCADEDFRRALP